MMKHLTNLETLCEDIFGLPYPPTKDELQAQYRKLVKVLHPDRGGDSKEFIRMKDAYEVLKPVAEEDVDRERIYHIQGVPIDNLGNGRTPKMPKCLDCDGLGYKLGNIEVVENFLHCPDCAYTYGYCPRCRGTRIIKVIRTQQINRICRPCEGTGEVYMSNPVFRINSFGR